MEDWLREIRISFGVIMVMAKLCNLNGVQPVLAGLEEIIRRREEFASEEVSTIALRLVCDRLYGLINGLLEDGGLSFYSRRSVQVEEICQIMTITLAE